MATETMPPSSDGAQKASRYRSVRRAQEQHAHQLGHCQLQEPAPPIPAPPAVPAVPAVPPTPAVPEMQSQTDAPVSRSMSRYHRRPTVSHATPSHAPPPPPPSAALHSHHAPPAAQLPASTSRSRAVSSPQHSSHAANIGQHRPRTAKQRADASPPVPHDARNQSLPGEDTAKELMLRERERQRLLKEKYEAEARAQKALKQAEIDRAEKQRQGEVDAARAKALADLEAADTLRKHQEEAKEERERGKRLRKAEDQKMRQQREEELRMAKQEEKERRARLEERSRRVMASPPVSPPRPEDGEAGLGVLKRRKDDGLAHEPLTKTSSPPRLKLSFEEREPETIRPGGGGAVLGIDAPTSAVNAGDRRVNVVCNKKRIALPVVPTTTPLDLIKTAATILTDPIDVRTAVISEMFTKVSITRPLRNYEYVRDVMNSWDYDTQNELTIIDSDVDGINQDDLLSYKVSETRPEGMSCFIQYSARPGKWTKKYLTLRPDGQLVMAKNEKTKEKDQENICTLTDYDIYSVTQQKLARVKPPKKICYAVKSMQKSNIFADESQYVHFFCTNDRNTATMFYRAIQGWRSWYLKFQKGEGLKKKTPASRNVSGAGAGAGAGAVQTASSHTRGESVGSHYQLGAFTSLLDMDSFNKTLDSIEVHRPGEYPDNQPLGKLGSQAMHARKKSVRQKQPPPAAFGRSGLAGKATSQPLGRSGSVRRSVDQQEEDTFATGGLLGRAYTQRQAALQARDQSQSGPFTDGPSLLNTNVGLFNQAAANESGLTRNSSVRSNHHRRTSSDLHRSVSKRAPGAPAPLVDLTPTYRPPPQFANKGKGFNPGAGAGPLVESATSPEEAIQVPSSTDWRAGRPGASRAAHGTYGSAGVERTRSLKGRGEPLAAYTQNNHSGAPEDDTNAFTGGGLLAQSGYAQGPATGGRGVMDGSKARGPMLDMRDEKQFNAGGLLSGLANTNAPIIDRSGK
ncbi:hypothetical protein ACN47E_005630 [Coniothyrium glycines]